MEIMKRSRGGGERKGEHRTIYCSIKTGCAPSHALEFTDGVDVGVGRLIGLVLGLGGS